MAPEGVAEGVVFLSTLPASRRQQRLALAVLWALLLAFTVLAPFARVALQPMWAFIPAYESALVINALMTAALLFAQAAILGSVALLVLASGYLLTALMAVSHALSFPGLLSDSGLLGAGAQTTAWLYMLWHASFPLFVLGYATLDDGGPRARPPAAALALGIGAIVALACAFTLLATAGHGILPAIMRANGYTPAMVPVVSAVVLLNGLAFLAVWRRRARSALDLWLVVVMCAWLLDVALSAGLNAGRFDVGFYAGRVCGILAASFVLGVLLLENSVLYARLVAAHQRERSKGADLLRANQELDAANRELATANRELDDFSHSVSHDLRAPLRGVDGCASILEEDYGEALGADGRRLVAAIRGDCRRMAQLIDNLLAFARLGRRPLQTRPVALNELVESVRLDLGHACNGRDVRFSVDELGTAEADPALLKEVFANLLGNAVKFTGRKERAAVDVGSMRDPAFDGPIYFVRDDGAGFDMRHADELFRVFERLHRQDEFEGTGVGLAIVQRIIERHGGRIWAEAEPDRGATFYFTLKAGLP